MIGNMSCAATFVSIPGIASNKFEMSLCGKHFRANGRPLKIRKRGKVVLLRDDNTGVWKWYKVGDLRRLLGMQSEAESSDVIFRGRSSDQSHSSRTDEVKLKRTITCGRVVGWTLVATLAYAWLKTSNFIHDTPMTNAGSLVCAPTVFPPSSFRDNFYV